MKRVYQTVVESHLLHDEQMLFLAGPRQVGKTTISQDLVSLTSDFHYFNWDVKEHRTLIMRGAQTLGDELSLTRPRQKKPIIVFDEIHKYANWKNYLKGFYDLFHLAVHIVVTGSAKLDVYKAGGDSLMGRYFPYRIHPFSVAEIVSPALNKQETQPAKKIKETDFNALWQYGGFPEPFIRRENEFYLRWKNLRNKQLFKEDIRDLTQIHEVDRMELLSELLRHQAGQLLNRQNLANKIDASVSTIGRWLEALNRVYYCFFIKPWHKNVTRSLLKEPKPYLWDWSLIEDEGARAESFVASHLLKAVHFWNDRGMGEYSLHFIRDKDKNEVDFLVVKNGEPWFLVEVKLSDGGRINPALKKFQDQLEAPHAFQVIVDLPYEDIDCFQYHEPVIVPAKTFLAQLV